MILFISLLKYDFHDHEREDGIRLTYSPLLNSYKIGQHNWAMDFKH